MAAAMVAFKVLAGIWESTSEMPKFAANLSLLFTEWNFLDRFAAAADAGFKAVEFLFPYTYPPDEIADRLNRHGLEQALFNTPPGDWEAGERGLAAVVGREEEFRQSIAQALTYATATGVKRLHVMSGIAPMTDPTAQRTFSENIRYAAERLEEAGINAVLEPLNPRDVPGYFFGNFDYTVRWLRQLNLPSLRLQFDVYHRQIIHGDIIIGLRNCFSLIDHIQIAGVPDRHEPTVGEIAYPAIFDELDRLGYDGWVGCEYHPASDTVSGLDWVKPWLAGST